jgi:hypothetical protein
MREIYSVEYRGDKGQIVEKHEDMELSKGRAHELALRWCRQCPDCVAVIYFEVEKPNGLDFKGRRKFAAETVTERVVRGRAYSGPKVFSTMMRRGTIRNNPDVETVKA